MTARRILRWPSAPPVPRSRRPYRDAAFLHAALGVLIVAFAWLSGGAIGRALVVALAYIVAATAWSWFRLHQRRRRAAAAAEHES